MTIEELRELTGMNRATFAREFGIPYRTVEDWEKGSHNPPEYICDLIERVIRSERIGKTGTVE